MNPKLLLAHLGLFLAATNALPNPEAEADPAALANPEVEVENLAPQACDYTVGCTSKAGVQSGLYCGYCAAVLGKWNPDWVYQLNGKGGKNSCCTFKTRNDCVARTAPCPIR